MSEFRPEIIKLFVHGLEWVESTLKSVRPERVEGLWKGVSVCFSNVTLYRELG